MDGEPLDDIAFSRTGIAPPLGTLTADVGCKVDPATADAFLRMCRQAGTDRSGALRNYVYKVVHGKTYEQICLEAQERREGLLLGEGAIEGLIGGAR